MIHKLLLGFVLSSFLATAEEIQTISLAGKWQIRLDPTAVGETSKWAAKPLEQAMIGDLPGSLTSNGIGNEVGMDTPWMGSTEHSTFSTDPRYAPYRQPGNIKVPFWLQPVKYYKGKAWFQREINIPGKWNGKHIKLFLERCHWSSTVWIDGNNVGTNESLSVPHRYELGALSPGKHLLTICIDNGYLIRVGKDASSITDHTQTNWNGIIGKIELSAHDSIILNGQQIYPQNSGATQVKVDITNNGAVPKTSNIHISISDKKSNKQIAAKTKTIEISPGVSTVTCDLKLNTTPELWSEFSPNLYTMTTTIGNETISSCFGFREIKSAGRTLLVNEVPTYLRGNLDCAAFPLTGYPSTSVAEWKRIYSVYTAYGLNHVRFHSWCPPEAAFVAADEVGMYLQVECGIWRGPCEKTGKPVETFMYEEATRICREYGNHPSFVLFTHGNEPWELDKKKITEEWVPAMKILDPRHLVTACAHYIIHPNNDYQNPGPGGGMNLRYHGELSKPPTTASDYESIINKEPAPCVAHEPGEWCAFPNLKEIPKYKGVLKANNFEIVRDFMANNHILDQADDFLMASGKFQTLIYKEETEKFLRTRGLGGFQMLGLNDFPGQGTALVGVVDVFWDPKPYVSAAEYKRFSGPVVPLALMKKRTWTSDETFTVQLRIAQYSGSPIKNAKINWEITASNGSTVAKEKTTVPTIPIGNETLLGDFSFPLKSVMKADKLTLSAAIEGTNYKNDWNFWVYPKASENSQDKVVICHQLEEAIAKLTNGFTVLLLTKTNQIIGKTCGTFAPIFWNMAWFPGQREHTLGMLIQNRHPAFSNFPTDSYADWQWWDLMNRYKPMILDSLPAEVRGIAQPIDDWNSCRRLAMILECRVGAGKLMIVSCDIENDLGQRPVARQLRQSLLTYMNSSLFAPQHRLTEEQLSTIIAKGTPPSLIKRITASSEGIFNTANSAIDGDTQTCWESNAGDNAPVYPHYLDLTLTQSSKVSGINFFPRQDGDTSGFAKEIEILTSMDGVTWSTAIKTSLTNNHEWKSVSFPPCTANHIKIICLSPQTAGNYRASFSEIEPVSDK